MKEVTSDEWANHCAKFDAYCSEGKEYGFQTLQVNARMEDDSTKIVGKVVYSKPKKYFINE